MQSIMQKYSPFPTALLPGQPDNGNDYFILFGTTLNLPELTDFQEKCGRNFVIFDCWRVGENTVVLLQGRFERRYVEYAHELRLDAALIDFNARLSQPGLLVMDMDSTAIKIECIDEIAKLAGTGDEVSAITAAAMRGELDFEQSLRRRVATLKDAPEQILSRVRERLPLMEGLRETVAALKQQNWKVAIASGGFTYFADYLKEMLALDAAVSNRFEIIDGKLTGRLKGDIVHAQYKANTLKLLAQEFGVDLRNTVAIGDGANDLVMMSAADLGAAFHAKPKVQQQAQVMVNFADLTGLLCLLSANDKVQRLKN